MVAVVSGAKAATCVPVIVAEKAISPFRIPSTTLAATTAILYAVTAPATPAITGDSVLAAEITPDAIFKTNDNELQRFGTITFARVWISAVPFPPNALTIEFLTLSNADRKFSIAGELFSIALFTALNTVLAI